MPTGMDRAGSALNTGAAVGGSIAAIGVAAGAVQAVPIAGQVIGAALGLTAVMMKVFGGKRKAKKQQQEDSARRFLKQRQQNMRGRPQAPQPQQQAPETQGYGQFQQMQAGEGPIYQSGQPQAQPGV